MGKAVERIFLPLMQLTLPEIVDVNLPAEGVFHNLMIVSIKKSYAGHARKIMNGIWAMGQAMFTKCIIVVDEDCDVQDLAESHSALPTTSILSVTSIHPWPCRFARPRQPPTQLGSKMASTQRASGALKASLAPGHRCLRWMPLSKQRSMRCGRSWG